MKISDVFVISNRSKIDKKYHAWLKDAGYPAAANSQVSKEAALQECVTNIVNLCQSWTPRVVIHNGHALFIFKSGLDWAYLVDDSKCAHLGHPTAEGAEKSARRHLAQILYSHHDDGKSSFDAIDLDDLEGQSDHESWCRFQRAYRTIQTEHPELDSAELHRLACNAS